MSAGKVRFRERTRQAWNTIRYNTARVTEPRDLKKDLLMCLTTSSNFAREAEHRGISVSEFRRARAAALAGLEAAAQRYAERWRKLEEEQRS